MEMLCIGTGPEEQTREAQKQQFDMGCDLKEEKESTWRKKFSSHARTKYRWIKDLKWKKRKSKVKCKVLKLEENIERYFGDLGVGKYFL